MSSGLSLLDSFPTKKNDLFIILSTVAGPKGSRKLSPLQRETGPAWTKSFWYNKLSFLNTKTRFYAKVRKSVLIIAKNISHRKLQNSFPLRISNKKLRWTSTKTRWLLVLGFHAIHVIVPSQAWNAISLAKLPLAPARDLWHQRNERAEAGWRISFFLKPFQLSLIVGCHLIPKRRKSVE